MWSHCLQRLCARCPGLFSTWLTGVDARPSVWLLVDYGDADADCRGWMVDVPSNSVLG